MSNKNTKNIPWKVWHGSLGNENWVLPKCAAKTDKVNRKDQGNSTNASEYLDDPKVLDAKMKIVADLIKKSKCMVAYTGAGISRASGIPDYGTKAKNSVMNQYQKLKNPAFAQPTYSHHVLANLEKAGLLHYYVQQNHDGLPQKAGFPQSKMNEIHGAWFDPSNPVVQFSGSLRSDLFQAMAQIENSIDLCLCLGTSLSGMNADRCVTTPCEKFSGGVENCFGSVIVNLQFTPVDKEGYVPIRIWAKIDDAMKLLVKHLKLPMKKIKLPLVRGNIVECPYNKKGQFDQSKKMILDMSIGAKVVICQPGAMNEGAKGVVTRKDEHGHYLVQLKERKRKKKDEFVIRNRRFGGWWLDTLKKGDVMQMPLMNIKPKFADVKK